MLSSTLTTSSCELTNFGAHLILTKKGTENQTLENKMSVLNAEHAVQILGAVPQVTAVKPVLPFIAKFTEMGIEQEIAVQHEIAVNSLDNNHTLAREYVNRHIESMPVMLSQDYTLKHYTKFPDKSTYVKQSGDLSTALWLIALQLTLQSRYIAYSSLNGAIKDWLKHNAVVTTDVNTENWAKRYIAKMHKLNLISTELSEFSVVVDNSMVDLKAFAITDSVNAELDDIFQKLALTVPMKCTPLHNKPQDWVSNKQGIGELANIPMVKGYISKSPIAQGVLDAVNKLQSVAVRRSPVMLKQIDILRQNSTVSKEDDLRFNAIVDLPDTPVYFPLTLDKRGRMYPRGGISSYQGTDVDKASYEFAVGRPLGKYGFVAIQIQVANTLGYDKLSMDDRVTATQSAIDAGLLDVDTADDVEDMYPSASKYQAFVAIVELRNVIKWTEAGNNVEDYISHLVCHRDGTANGIQHMSALTKHRQTAINVNCTASNRTEAPQDIYGVICDTAITCAMANGDVDTHNILVKYGRDITKLPIMIRSYGAGELTITRTIKEFLLKKNDTATNIQSIAQTIIKSIDINAEAINRIFNNLSAMLTKHMKLQGIQLPKPFEDDIAYTDRYKVEWTTVDGFTVCTEYRDNSDLAISAGNYSSIRKGQDKLDKSKTISALAPNFVHSIDACHIRMVALACDWELLTIHDSIGSHAGTFIQTGRIIRQQFVELHHQMPLTKLYDEFDTTNYVRGDYNVDEALKAIYMFS